jgi:hypothetical protein
MTFVSPFLEEGLCNPLDIHLNLKRSLDVIYVNFGLIAYSFLRNTNYYILK